MRFEVLLNWDGLRGYLRPDGRYGLRNRVLVLAAADNVNPLAYQLASQVAGSTCIPATFGRGQLGADLENTIRTLVGIGTNPNVADVLIVSFELESAMRVASPIAAAGRNVQYLSLLDAGGHSAALEIGRGILQEMIRARDAIQAVSVPPSALMLGLECGGSDATSGLVANPVVGRLADSLLNVGGTAIFSEPVELIGCEDMLDRRARVPEVAREVRALTRHYASIAEAAGVDLVGINPTADNIAGGLTTIEEKSLGAVSKSGTAQLEGTLEYGARPPRPGLWLMDGPAAAVENLTALAAGGCQAILFTSGSVNPSGNPVSPTVKLCANPLSNAAMSEHVDVDLSGVLTSGKSLETAVIEAHATLIDILSGREPRADGLGYTETRISRIGLSV